MEELEEEARKLAGHGVRELMVIAQDTTDLDEVAEPQFDILAEDVPTFCPNCGSLLMY